MSFFFFLIFQNIYGDRTYILKKEKILNINISNYLNLQFRGQNVIYSDALSSDNITPPSFEQWDLHWNQFILQKTRIIFNESYAIVTFVHGRSQTFFRGEATVYSYNLKKKKKNFFKLKVTIIIKFMQSVKKLEHLNIYLITISILK